jgi:hypothetical protein
LLVRSRILTTFSVNFILSKSSKLNVPKIIEMSPKVSISVFVRLCQWLDYHPGLFLPRKILFLHLLQVV